MSNTTVNREKILPILININNIVERKQTLPILANVLVDIGFNQLKFTATDLEIQLKTSCEVSSNGIKQSFTLPARKFLDICKSLPKNADIDISIDNDKATITDGQAKFKIATLPAQDYPSLETLPAAGTFIIGAWVLKDTLKSVAACMAKQDARIFLNGVCLDLTTNPMSVVATNGHRLALTKDSVDIAGDAMQIILPYKSVNALLNLLGDSTQDVFVEYGETFCRFKLGDGTSLITKLIDGKYPDYQRVIPKNYDKTAIVDREEFKQALVRASLLSNERFKGVKLDFSKDKLGLESSNTDGEKSNEELAIDYKFDNVSIGFNIDYLIDVLNTLPCKEVAIDLTDCLSSILIRDPDKDLSLYVVMPMRL